MTNATQRETSPPLSMAGKFERLARLSSEQDVACEPRQCFENEFKQPKTMQDVLVDESPPPRDPRVGQLVELLLKRPAEVDRLVADPAEQGRLVPRFVAIALAGFATFGVAATLALNASQAWPRHVPPADWLGASAGNLVIAYCAGFVAAIGVCLPSFYFYTLLAGVRLTMLAVTTHAVKSLAAGAVALVGIVPIALSMVLGIEVFGLAPLWGERASYTLLIVPFISGLYAVYSLYAGILDQAERQRLTSDGERTMFLKQLIVAWSVCYTAVTPLMVYTLWNQLPR